MDTVKIDLDVNQYTKTKSDGTVEEDPILKEDFKSKWTLINNRGNRDRVGLFE